MAHCEVGVSCHGSMHGARSQVSTELPIVGVGWDGSNHVGGIDIFQSAHQERVGIDRFSFSLSFLIGFKILLVLFSFLLGSLITVLGDSFFQVLANILNKSRTYRQFDIIRSVSHTSLLKLFSVSGCFTCSLSDDNHQMLFYF